MTKSQKIGVIAAGLMLLLGAAASNSDIETNNVNQTASIVEEVDSVSIMDEAHDTFSEEIFDKNVEDIQEVVTEKTLHDLEVVQQPPKAQNTETEETSSQATVVSEPEEDNEPPQSVPAFTSEASGQWYVSSHYSSKYYYHESCDGWQGLSERYLRVFSSEAALKAAVSGRVLHYDCEPY